MNSLDFWKQVKEARELLKKNKVENYQTITISDDIFNMLYKDAERKEKLEEFVEIIKRHEKHDVANAMSFDTYFEYTDYCEDEMWDVEITENEFNLLKEMLGEK